MGGRQGWSLPTREQLATLVDPGKQNPALPAGHPFIGVQFDVNQTAYFTSSVDAEDFGHAWVVNFYDGDHFTTLKSVSIPENNGGRGTYVWCVRGGQTYHTQHPF